MQTAAALDTAAIEAELQRRLDPAPRHRAWSLRPIPCIVCADGFSVSVQASQGAYCQPRNDQGPWHAVELGYPSQADDLIAQYAESPSCPTDTVYGFVPLTLVAELVARHGGFAADVGAGA